MDNKLREKAITRTSMIGILANLFLAGFKAVAGLLAGSIAVVLDAVNNLTDALSSVITIVGVKLAKKQPDHKHPYGYGRIEYFSTIIIALFVLSAGATSLVESAKKISVPEVPDYSVVTIVIIVASVIVKLVLGKFVKGRGEKYNSDALIASGADASFDAIISASTLVGAAVTYFAHISIDGFIGGIISIFIVKAGLEMLLEAMSDVVGNRFDSEITIEMKSFVASIPGVLGAYDLVLHNYGPDSAIGSIHVEVPAEMTARELHKLTVDIQEKVAEKFHIFLTVGFYAVDLVDEQKKAIRDNVRAICSKFDGVVNSHGVYVDKEKKKMSFDVVIDFSVKDRKELTQKIAEAVDKEYEGYTVEVNYDANYSD